MPNRGDGNPPPEGRAFRWGTGAWILGGIAFATLLVIVWITRPGVPGDRDGTGAIGGDRAMNAEGQPGGRADGPLRGIGNDTKPRPFRRLESVPQGTGPVPWQARIHTNGILDVDRMKSDPAYLRRVLQHDRLRTLLKSPARDTPECREVITFVDRKGLPLAAAVDFYNILWATRQHERRVADAATPADREPMDVVRELELTDFQRRFQHDFDVDVTPMLEELLSLPIHPTVFFGVPSRGFGAGEALLSD